MNPRTRLKREIIRRRRREQWPVTYTRITAPNGLAIRVRLYATAHGPTADYMANGQLVHASWPPSRDALEELNRWASVRCWTCMDYGYIDIHHPSTDGVVGSEPCPALDDPKYHPPSTPIPLAVATGSAHFPECTGDGSPLCCPPF